MRRSKKYIKKLKKILLTEGFVLIVVLLMVFVLQITYKKDRSEPVRSEKDNATSHQETENKKPDPVSVQNEEQERKKKQDTYLSEAEKLAAGYDYDSAIDHIKKCDPNYESKEALLAAVTKYEKEKAACVPFGAYSTPEEVNHVFFHSLIYDTSKAFDGDYEANGYNYYMTTVSEFKEMMNQMYEQGYVLVSIHDVVKQVTKDDGTITMEAGDIMLPEDKKPFVLSQDDVNYYDYMDGDGFASRLIIGKDGKPSTAILKEDGSFEEGDFDLVPILDKFVEEHPDFSYHGAKGMICLTGYEGTMGYRTDPASKEEKTYEEDKKTVQNVAKVMRENGWEFACHSNGHRNLEKESAAFLEYDTNQWLENVGSLVGETDVYVYPFGVDIQSGVGTYSNEKYQILKKAGFRIYCGVQATPWMQIKKDYVRMQRRPLDGQAMLMYPERLKDLFDLSRIIDSSRPKLQ